MQIEILQTNILATQQIIDVSFRNQIKYFMFSSSAAVYNESVHPVTEKTKTTNPPSLYGISKKTDEEMISLYGNRYNIPYICY